MERFMWIFTEENGLIKHVNVHLEFETTSSLRHTLNDIDV